MLRVKREGSTVAGVRGFVIENEKGLEVEKVHFKKTSSSFRGTPDAGMYPVTRGGLLVCS
jgi:hypothetical protein